MTASRFTDRDGRWPGYLGYLERVGMARHAVDDTSGPIDGNHYLGIELDGVVVGHISIREQEILAPETQWGQGMDHRLRAVDGGPLREAFVQTFAVEPTYRRRGFGRALQRAALDLTRELGCHQMRSWSSLDARENYRLKLALGFAAHPAISTTSTGLQVSGVYFVRAVDGAE